jgi:hypothetical protein
MKVEIINKKTNQPLATISLSLRGLNYTPTEDEYWNEAWQTAVSDKLVEGVNRKDCSFRLIK